MDDSVSLPTAGPYSFPVHLHFNNESQGQTIKHVGIDLRKPVFNRGQLYVALSRTTSSQGVNVLLPHDLPHKKQRMLYIKKFFSRDPVQQ